MTKHPAKQHQTQTDPLLLSYTCKARNPTGSKLKLKSATFTEAVNTLIAYLQPNGTAEIYGPFDGFYRITNADGLRMEVVGENGI